MREQGKFWEYHDRLFQNQQALEPDLLKKYAADTGLDPAKFNMCLDTASTPSAYRRRWALAISWVSARLRVHQRTDGERRTAVETFTAIIDEELERGRK